MMDLICSKGRDEIMLILNARSIRGDTRDKLAARMDGIIIDALTISETWLDARDIPGSYPLENYDFVRHDRQWGTRPNSDLPKIGGGMGIYIHQSEDTPQG